MNNLISVLKNRFIPSLLVLLLFTMQLPINAAAATEENAALVYNGSPSIEINNNIPTFTEEEITSQSFEKYGNLDALGRCTTAIASIGPDLMPTEERGSIGTIKPTGWKQNKYPGIVDSQPPYLYNRCHLIGYQLTAENANKRNLVTGTRYMNVEGMLPYENKVANYVESTKNHVMYRVIPKFEGNNLLCSGIQIEAYSVEDNGKGISFNVFCFNVQPGIIIDYSDGSNYADPNAIVTNQENSEETEKHVEETTVSQSTENAAPATTTASYIANTNTKKFHYPSCNSVKKMKEKNKLYFEGSRDELIKQGYEPCKNCNP